jgi:uncharacterized protein
VGKDAYADVRQRFLEDLQMMLEISDEKSHEIFQIIDGISFTTQISGLIPLHLLNNPILAIARDADRLDAIGAIGVARCCAYSALKNRPLLLCPLENECPPDSPVSAVDHFHEKLLKLKDLFLTEPGKSMAQSRHQFLLLFLNQLHSELN